MQVQATLIPAVDIGQLQAQTSPLQPPYNCFPPQQLSLSADYSSSPCMNILFFL